MPTSPSALKAPAAGSKAAATLVGAGDIADCRFQFAAATALLLDKIPGTVMTVGDNVYENGTPREFSTCYESTWGRHKHRTKPAPGNHEYNTSGASGYYDYFGSNAGHAGLGYYSYDLGEWHILALNSSAPAGSSTPQYRFVRDDLRLNTKRCIAAYWHYPIFSSGYDGNLPHMTDIWRLLYESGAAFVVSGHAHNYERFAPLDGHGRPDPVRGIREFVVGTGGGGLTGLIAMQPHSENFQGNIFGVIKFTLWPTSYDWEFISTTGLTTDSGTGSCH